MGTETRIGIATGLLIVVVASVYFFYGSDRGSEELLIATGDQGAQPPRIPANGRHHTASPIKTHRATTPKNKPPRRKTAARHGRRHPPRTTLPPKSKRLRPSINGGGLAWADRRATKPPAPRPGINPRPARRARPMPNRTIPRTSPSHQQAQPLGAGASQALVDATQRNLHRPPFAAQSQKPASVAGLAEKRRPARPAETWPKRHRIGPGDTLSDISNRYYATSTLVGHILKANPGIKSPKALKIGDVLLIPAPTADEKPQAVAQQQSSVPAKTSPGRSPTSRNHKPGGKTTGAPRTYRVKNGDTFYRIAAKVLGNPARWKELYQRNRSVVGNDPMRLKPGMLLTLPE